MPFQSEKQRRYLHANHPEIAKRWERDYAGGGIAELNAQLNSLPEYYLPKNQGGRIGFNSGSGKTYDDWLNYRLKQIAKGLLPVPFKEWKKGKIEMNQGGFIPSHEAGIYGLAEGGRTGFYRGSDRHAGTGSSSSSGPSGPPGGGATSQGSGRDYSPPSTRAPDFVTRGGGTTKTTTPKSDSGGDGPINIHDDTLEVIEEQKKTDEINRQNALRQMVLDQSEKTETWEKAQTWNKPTITPGSVGVNLLTTFLTGGISNPWTKAAANRVVKWGADKIGVDNMINTFVDEKFGSIDEMKSKIEARVAKEDLIQSLPKGHPERIQLEESVKTKTTSKEGPNGDGEVTQDTSIKIENIEEVNDAKTQLLKKYEEMDEASLLAWQRQQVDRSKQMAYWKQMMAPYMSAQGGRVPAGYNTGGLSNLFRLKNR